jgi:hypothetical protein
MIEVVEARETWRKQFAAHPPSATYNLFFVRATARIMGRQLTNPQLPFSELEACTVLRPLCGDNTLDELARWMSHAQPGEFRHVTTRDAHITISCSSPAQLGLIHDLDDDK